MAGIYNFTIKQGATFTKTIVRKDSAGTAINLTGYKAKMIAKVRPQDTINVVDLMSGDGKMTLGTTDGTITITLTPDQTRVLDFKYAKYDLYLTSSRTTHLLSGEITLEGTTING